MPSFLHSSVARHAGSLLWALALVGGLAQAAALTATEWTLYRVVSSLPSRDD